MQQPDHDLRPFQHNALSPGRIIAIGAVALVHVLVIYALATGLAQNFIKKLPDEFKAEVVKEAPPPDQKAPPPPPPDLAKPPPPFVPPPDIVISNSSPDTNAISNVQSKHEAPPPPPPPAAVRPSPATAVAGTHTKPEYPPISRRLNEQGTVLLNVTINASGDVSDVTIAKSSGYSRLDQAASEWVKSHWRYHPATENGKPITSTEKVSITFNTTTGGF